MSIEDSANNLFRRFWDWRLVNAPEFATSIGVHDYDDRLDEMSLNSYFRRRDEAKFFLEELKNILKASKTESHSSTVALNLNLLEADLNQYISGLKLQTYLWPLNRLEGPQIDFPRLLSWMKKETINDVNKIIDRMRQFSQQIYETIQLLKEGVRIGLTMHKVSVDPLPKVYDEMSNQPVVESPIYKPFKEKPEQISNDEWKALVDTAKQIIETEVYPSYKSLSDFLAKEYMKSTRHNIGTSSLPNGQTIYAACLKFHTTTDLSPEQVHEIGKEEVARIIHRMEDVKNVVNFTGSLKEFRQFLRTDPKFKFSSASEIITRYEELGEKINKELPKYFARLPKAAYIVTPVPEEVAATFPGAYYLAPPQDGSRPGTFYINTYQPETRSTYEAVALSLHEAQPGHHLQTSLTMESGSLVDFRRFMEDRKYYEPPARFAMNTAYIEGWGLYSEYLGEEMGMYKDPYDLFGRLSHEMLRACRLVVDTGMHSLGWSRDKAVDYMANNTASDMHDITSEIDRYITWPGQACGYKIGEIKIKELRTMAKNDLSDKFDIGSFHDFIATMGGIPLDILEKQVQIYINNRKNLVS